MKKYYLLVEPDGISAFSTRAEAEDAQDAIHEQMFADGVMGDNPSWIEEVDGKAVDATQIETRQYGLIVLVA